MYSPALRGDRHTQLNRLRGVSRHGRYLGSSAPLPDLRARRLLRRFQEQARDQAFPRDEAPDHELARARRRLELVLRRRDRDAVEMSGPAALSKGEDSAGARTDFALRSAAARLSRPAER